MLGSKLTVLLFLLYSSFGYALSIDPRYNYYPEDFYSAVDAGLSDGALKDALFEILSSAHRQTTGHDQLSESCSSSSECYRHISLGYTRARQLLFGLLHLETMGSEYAVRDVYCRVLVDDKLARNQPPGPGQIPDPKVINAEHTWPQSKFTSRFPKDLQKSDLHILFPVLSRANSSRSNYEFGDIVTEVKSPCEASKRGYSSRGDSQIRFEVPDEQKGNSARAIFYFSVRYKTPIQEEQEASLRAWHHQDPPDSFESERQLQIFENQFDRNPFIDHPELVDQIKDF